MPAKIDQNRSCYRSMLILAICAIAGCAAPRTVEVTVPDTKPMHDAH